MAKAKLNHLLNEISGTIDGWTIKQTPHGTVITPKPEAPRKWSEKQKAHRQRMAIEARLFYSRQMEDPIKAAHYRARAKEAKIPVSSFVIGGFLKHGARFAEMEAPHSAPHHEAHGRDGHDSE